MEWLSSVTLRGFKSIDRIERFPLSAINVFIGANGVGKSNFISFFGFLRAIVEGRLARTVASEGGANVLLHHGAKRTREISFDLSFMGGTNSYGLSLGVTTQDGLIPTEEVVRSWDREKHTRPYEDRLAPGPQEAAVSNAFNPGPAWWVHREILALRRYHFHDTGALSALRRTADLNDNDSLASDGSNLAPYLFFCARSMGLLTDRSFTRFGASLHSFASSCSIRSP